jgi:hypothetical protein
MSDFIKLGKGGRNYPRRGTEHTCRECMAMYRKADKLVRKAREVANIPSTPYDEEASRNLTLDTLREMFGMK